MINDFGILSIHISGTGRVRVLSYGREVFIMPPERIEKDERGPWLHVLAAIANDLVATFGMPGNTQRHLHWELTMNFEVVNIYSSRNAERSIVIYDDGTLMLRTTTNAFGVLSGYRQTTDKPTTIEDVARLSPSIAAEVAQVLARLMTRAVRCPECSG
jgi:hypothetical protein